MQNRGGRAAGVEVTYANLADRVHHAAGILHAQGVRADMHVAVMLAHHLDHIVTFFAIMEIGAVHIPINTALKGMGLVEIGHSIGLYHLPVSSYDSMNYNPQYWQLRTKNGSVTKACAPGTTDGAGCVGPRYNDPLTVDEIDNVINGFATSSVMDYPGDQTLDMFVIGKPIGGGVPCAAYGMTEDLAARVSEVVSGPDSDVAGIGGFSGGERFLRQGAG